MNLLYLELLGWVFEDSIGAVEASTIVASHKGEGEKVVVVGVEGFVVGDDEVGREGAVGECACFVGIEIAAESKAVAAIFVLMDGDFDCGGDGLEWVVDGCPLVAVDDAESTAAVEEARIGRIGEDGDEVGLGEVYVLGFEVGGWEEREEEA